MTAPHRSVLIAIATLGLLVVNPALGQSHATVPGNSLESMSGITDPNAMNEAWQTPLMAAAHNADEKLVKDLIARKANVNVGSKFGMTALMYARGVRVVKLLLAAGAAVNDKDISGKTALYYATASNDPDAVKAMIEAGADVNAKDDKERTALGLAKLNLCCSGPFADEHLREAYRARSQAVIDILLAAGAVASGN
jgi:hypothetical protein